MAQGRDDSLAYGDPPEDWPEDSSERGILGDTYRRLRGRYSQQQQYDSGTSTGNYPTQSSQQGGYNTYGGYNQPSQSSNQPYNTQTSSAGGMASLFDRFHDVLHGIGSDINQAISGQGPTHSHTHAGADCGDGVHDHSSHRFGSFAGERDGNDVKWFVDGCSYMWAVSRALEQASESIWILDWWLSPELYLRRPPSKNEPYRIDRMLQAAAQRGVKVNIIVYKEVTQALTRKYLSPSLPDYLHSLLPRSTDPITSGLSRLGLAVTFKSLETVEAENPLMAPPITVSSSHTKHALENLHPNIAVFRHPDHLPDAQTLESSFLSSLQNLSLTAATASKLPGNALKALYGVNEDVILYWAHHEKLLLVDGRLAFMGGLDLCYGRWDTNQHSIADAHPEDLNKIVFPGQDFNNARVMDFQDVANWQNNKLDRSTSSRMGWSDLSICLSGPVVEDLRAHFVERWNFIYDEKYYVRKDQRYSRLAFTENTAGVMPSQGTSSSYDQPQRPPYQPPQYNQQQTYQGASYTQGTQQQYANQPYEQNPGSTPYHSPPPQFYRGVGDEEPGDDERSLSQGPNHHRPNTGSNSVSGMGQRVTEDIRHIRDEYGRNTQHHGRLHGHQKGGMSCQIMRSCAKWSHGVPTEHSIANAYISVIQNSEHFIYIENQFFITATSDKQKPVKNKIGDAIVERILRAARAGEKYKAIVMMPAVPAFAGDLKDDSSLGTRAIMEFQYSSINRGGYSIMEQIAKAGYEPTDYIRFYNLRNYDRINCGAPMREAEQRSGVTYDEASRQHDDAIGAGYDDADRGNQPGHGYGDQYQQYQQYQQGAQQMGDRYGQGKGRWDSVSECYMLGGEDIRNVPWENGNLAEIDAFVSEELYIHSKILIADDRLVLCGSANLNDRSQLGYHDSEICILVSDPTPLPSSMNGRPYQASKFAATLRRQLFRKHLGLLKAQDMEQPDANYEPIGVPNDYDFGSQQDEAVTDPLSEKFLNLWNVTARRNTDIFGQIFHPVPHDSVRTWKDYDKFYSHFFQSQDTKTSTKEQASQEQEDGSRSVDKKLPKAPSKYQWGHVVAENFSIGEQGAREVKELLAGVRGTLVEMPLLFLIEEDIAKEGLEFNAFTEEVYT
ncbi:MAG: hypothetical protein M1812_005419 [Candelaria pacifica]|nr:MAG: hypothetical protein M1812_005419 [Candelaria pacifica]